MSSPTPPPPPYTVLASSRAVIANRITPATILLSPLTGKILAIHTTLLPASSFPASTPYTDYTPHLLLPGLVDAHVHLNEPGRTEWEGFWTGTRAAAFGGVTTVIDMPLNAIPPTTTVKGFEEKLAAAEGKCWVDVGFYGGVVPGNEGELKVLVGMGVRGFKGFLIDSGVDEFPAVSMQDVEKAMLELKDEQTVLMFHAEMLPPSMQQASEDKDITSGTGSANTNTADPTSYTTFLDSRPPLLETHAIDSVISLAHLAPDLPLHIVHLSATEAIPSLRKAREQGVHITAETCYHYLSLAAERIAAGDTRHKCCPPIRTQTNQDGLWRELMAPEDSVIKTIVSDHSPCTPNLKLLPSHLADAAASADSAKTMGDFLAAWGGIASVGLGISILWTEGREKGITATDIVRWCCTNTAKQVGLEDSKGELKVGMDADVIVFDDDAEFVVQKSTMLFRNKCSPYENKTLRGSVRETWLRGRRIFTREDGGTGEFDESKGPTGALLLEPRTSRNCL